jgi:hypothetical protein
LASRFHGLGQENGAKLSKKLFKNEHTVLIFLEEKKMFFREASNLFNRGSIVKQKVFIFKKPRPVGPRDHVIGKLRSIII